MVTLFVSCVKPARLSDQIWLFQCWYKPYWRNQQDRPASVYQVLCESLWLDCSELVCHLRHQSCSSLFRFVLLCSLLKLLVGLQFKREQSVSKSRSFWLGNIIIAVHSWSSWTIASLQSGLLSWWRNSTGQLGSGCPEPTNLPNDHAVGQNGTSSHGSREWCHLLTSVHSCQPPCHTFLYL